MTNEQMTKYGKIGVIAGFVISLPYYTVIIGGPIFVIGGLFILSTNMSTRKKLMWTLIPAITWWPTMYLLVVLAYELEKVTASFLNRYVVANLTKDQSYLLKFGDATLRAPRYDIAAFENQITTNVPKLTHVGVLSLMTNATDKEKESSLFENVYLIWIVIGLVGIILGFISFRMIKELGKSS